MGQKVNPYLYRLGLNNNWRSRWFGKGKDFSKFLLEDVAIRELITKMTGPQAGISEIIIERGVGSLTIYLHSARPGVLIGRGGTQLEILRRSIAKLIKRKFNLEIVEIKKADADAKVVAQSIGMQISKRMPFRRAVKQMLQKVKAAGVDGVRIRVAGRLDGAEISRDETFTDGSVPLTTLRKNVQFAKYDAPTTYGIVGIKVWINPGEKV